MTDYVLTVAVSIAAGVAALTSIFPGLFDYRVLLGVGFVAVLWIGNLRGIRESANVFALPIFVYLVGDLRPDRPGPLAVRRRMGFPPYVPPPGWAEAHGSQALGHPAHPSRLRVRIRGADRDRGRLQRRAGLQAAGDNATRGASCIMMGALFATIFLGISFLASQLGIVPDPTEQETVISQITRTLVGAGSPFHYAMQLTTALLLVLAANTAYAGFPRLASILGKDGFMPRQFQFRGDRLSFSVGIMVLVGAWRRF